MGRGGLCVPANGVLMAYNKLLIAPYGRKLLLETIVSSFQLVKATI